MKSEFVSSFIGSIALQCYFYDKYYLAAPIPARDQPEDKSEEDSNQNIDSEYEMCISTGGHLL